MGAVIVRLNRRSNKRKYSPAYARWPCYILASGRRTTIIRGYPMSRMQTRLVRKMALAGLAAFCVSSVAFGQTAALSDAPAYVTVSTLSNGTKYVLINGADGTVLAAARALNGTAIVVPGTMGTQPASAAAPAQSSALTSTSAPSTSTQTVYQDSTTTVTATPQSNGTTQFNVLSANTCPTPGCSGGGGS
jgi:hypothetical protein